MEGIVVLEELASQISILERTAAENRSLKAVRNRLKKIYAAEKININGGTR